MQMRSECYRAFLWYVVRPLYPIFFAKSRVTRKKDISHGSGLSRTGVSA
jgi:hypothetical protein